ncbi:MAG: glycoside hydrolase family 2 TIM barrel-domain containing protein, partial [Bryobacterales bacterium]|nr:glycoside hydrolase family 2 TIM barrel-domain containing protein [Bryobacterales bacterium]
MKHGRTSIFLLALACPWLAPAGTGYRDDRVSLNGTWRFQLRRDNRLLAAAPVRFGPVSASSQAAFLDPASGMETSAGRWFTSPPVPVAGTILAAEAGSNWSRQVWRPHPQQRGPTWWQLDMGAARSLRAVAGIRINWVKPANVVVRADISPDGAQWTDWGTASADGQSAETWIRADPARARFVRLHFAPEQFPGTRLIEVFLRGPDGVLTPWLPLPQRTWYEELRKYEPSDGFHLPGYSDASWSDIQVPSYWEVAKFSEPTWWQPDDAVGYYRRSFTLPEKWRGRHVRLRFEGVNNSAQVWVNGHEVGYHESGFTVFEFDVTPHLKFGQPNTIAVRVSKWTLTHEYDTDDVWFLGGIWRDTYLYSLPAQRIDDYTLRTELDSGYKDAVLRANLALANSAASAAREYEVQGELTGPGGKPVAVAGLKAAGLLAGRAPLSIELAGRIRNPMKWTAETPHLYTLALRLRIGGRTAHEFQTSIGFRQIEVKGDKVLLNGVPLRVHGVVTTRANPNDSGEDLKTVFAREIRILKESNINTIRSHTTPLEEDFLDLCDRHGIYVVPDVPGVWFNEGDFRYLADGEVLRAREIYQQHKNRPSVVMWHIGNENGPSSGYRPMGQAARWLRENDPTRPVTICDNEASVEEYGAAVKDLHYYGWPPLEPTSAPFLMGEFHGVPEEVERLKDRGFEETWGRSLQGGWGIIDGKPWVIGALICCWDDGSVNGNLGPRQWGLVDSKRHAKDLAFHVGKAFARVRMRLDGPRLELGKLSGALGVSNLYSYSDLSDHKFRWELLARGRTMTSGAIQCRVKPQSSASIPIELEAPAGVEILRVSVSDREGFSVQSEDFALTPGAFGLPAADLLAKSGF